VDALAHNVRVEHIYFQLGNVYYDQRDYDRAEYAYRRAIEHDPEHLSAHHNLAVVFRRQGRIAESVKQRKKANRLAAKHPERVEFSQDQVAYLRRFAKRFLLTGVGAVLGLLLLLWLASVLIG